MSWCNIILKLHILGELDMIAQIRGKLVETSLTSIIVDVNGIGYQLFIPMSTYDKLPLINEEVALLTYLHVREDAMLLYGFSKPDEKQLFEMLISVSGVGAKVALNILSSMSVSMFCTAITSDDIKTITCINGIGKKTAERLIIELRDKVAKFAPELAVTSNDGDVQCEASLDALLALEQLGFKRERAQKVLKKIVSKLSSDECSSENIIRKALKALNT